MAVIFLALSNGAKLSARVCNEYQLLPIPNKSFLPLWLSSYLIFQFYVKNGYLYNNNWCNILFLFFFIWDIELQRFRFKFVLIYICIHKYRTYESCTPKLLNFKNTSAYHIGKSLLALRRLTQHKNLFAEKCTRL